MQLREERLDRHADDPKPARYALKRERAQVVLRHTQHVRRAIARRTQRLRDVG